MLKLELIFGILFRLRTAGWPDGRVEVIIMLSQLSVVAVVEAGAELGNKSEKNCEQVGNQTYRASQKKGG